MNALVKLVTRKPTAPPARSTTADLPACTAELSPQEITAAIIALEKEWHQALKRLHNQVCPGGSHCHSTGQWLDTSSVTHYDEQGRAYHPVRGCAWNRNSTAAQTLNAHYAQQIAALTEPPPPPNPVAQAVEEGRRQGADLFSQMLTAQEFERIMNLALDGLEEGSDLYERTRNLFERRLEEMMEDDQ